jgi:hypothetical protein
MLRPVLLFFPCAVSYGGLYTFLPLRSEDAATGLLLFGCGVYQEQPGRRGAQ